MLKTLDFGFENLGPGESVRRLWLLDIQEFRSHLARLDRKSLYDRFGMFPSKAFLDTYAEGCFGIDALTYGYFVNGVLRGAGELRGLKSAIFEKTPADCAFSVESEWRRRGIGTRFLARILRAARNRNIHDLRLSCLSHNAAMVGLAGAFSAELSFETEEITGKLLAKTPSNSSIFGELADNSIGLANAVLDYHKRALREFAA